MADFQQFSFLNQALVIAPTREIAVQGSCVALDVAGASLPDLKVHTFIGGLAIAEDQVKLKKCHMAIGTPGKFIKTLVIFVSSPPVMRNSISNLGDDELVIFCLVDGPYVVPISD